jgi:hypothetical protein
MTSPIIYGYLERPYLSDPYLGGFVIEHLGSQVKLVIADEKVLGSEVERKIATVHYLGSQVNRDVGRDTKLGSQIDLEIADDESLGSEIDRKITNIHYLGSQIDLSIMDEVYVGSQVNQDIISDESLGSQVDRRLADADFSLASEIRREKYISHWQCEDLGYLSQDYLTTRYLVAGFCAHIGGQIERVIADYPEELASQVDLEIQDNKILGSEVERVIEDYVYVGSQIQRFNALTLGSQIRFVLYNTTKIRILCDFPSRGSAGAGNNAWGNPKGEGLNWQSSSTLAGDFDASNLNTDIVEQVWRSNNVLTATISCDTELAQGTAPDTFAILNHNFTTSAVVVFEGSNDSGFATIGITIPIYPDAINAYYIAPTLPTNQYRYWRLNITDPTNPADYLQVGTIVFGSAIIFQGEDIIDSIRRRTRHFSDKVETEGFSNVSNDRALKRAISLGFNSLDYDKGNYANLSGIFETARTSLKCLWIPDPQDPKRFAVFGKLVEIPEEEHVNRGSAANLVSLQVEVDESL